LGRSPIETPVDDEIGVRGNTLADLQADSADCTKVVAVMNGHQLIPADRHTLDWSDVPEMRGILYDESCFWLQRKRLVGDANMGYY